MPCLRANDASKTCCSFCRHQCRQEARSPRNRAGPGCPASSGRTNGSHGSWALMSALDGRAGRCRRRKNPFVVLALVKATQRLLSCCSLAWAHPFRTASRLDCLGFAVTFELAQFVILHDPEHEWAFLNNFNSSPVFSIANSLLHHPFKNLGPSPHRIYPTSASVAERRGLRKLMISRSFCGKVGLQLWMQASALPYTLR
jgi:hypothetical protein